MIKVLVVDDSALMRNQLMNLFNENGFDTDYARNGQECLRKLTAFAPDVITLDINMPVMDGLSCLRQIMRKRPTPVLMVSSLTTEGAKASIEALSLGAVDFIPKPSGSIPLLNKSSTDLLIQKVNSAKSAKLKCKQDFKSKFQQYKLKKAHSEHDPVNQTRSSVLSNRKQYKLITIGVSTGGPSAIQEILQNLPAEFPVPIVIAQHMPARFTSVFVERLNHSVPMAVQEVTEFCILQAGNVYIAKGDADLEIRQYGAELSATCIEKREEEIWHPSVNHLVSSATQVLRPDKMICVLLTGMGNDGANAMFKAFMAGAYTIAESEQTATVFGMPKELINLGGASTKLANYAIAGELCDLVK